MTNTEFIKVVAEEANFTQKDVKTILDAIQDVACKALFDGDSVRVLSGLTLSTRTFSARTGRNPRTGEPLEIPEKRIPRAKFGKVFKVALA